MFAALTMLVLSAEPAALTSARQHLEAGRIDEVLFDLEGQQFPEEHRAAAADVLASAASKSFTANDDLMALQLAQMALRHAAKHGLAHEIAARASLRQQQFENAEKHGDAWFFATASPDARLFRAQLALDQADPSTALALLDKAALAKLNPQQKTAAEQIRKQAQIEQAERAGGMTQIKGLEARMAKAAAEARAIKVVDEQPALRADDIVVYTSVGCGFCTEVKRFLGKRKIPFTEKDVEKDPSAAQELTRKMIKQKIPVQGGVPWTDVRGKLVRGWDKPKLEEALKQ